MNLSLCPRLAEAIRSRDAFLRTGHWAGTHSDPIEERSAAPLLRLLAAGADGRGACDVDMRLGARRHVAARIRNSLHRAFRIACAKEFSSPLPKEHCSMPIRRSFACWDTRAKRNCRSCNFREIYAEPRATRRLGTPGGPSGGGAGRGCDLPPQRRKANPLSGFRICNSRHLRPDHPHAGHAGGHHRATSKSKRACIRSRNSYGAWWPAFRT